jgi:hypothetical protein
MLNKIVILMLGVLLCSGGLAQATDFYTDVTIQNGDVYNDFIYVHNNATVKMTGGQVADIQLLDASVLNMSEGSLSFLWLANTSTANLSGGTIGLGFVYALDQSAVNIYGYGFTPTPYGTADLLSGFWADNNPFAIQLRRTHLPDEHYVLHEVPEPASMFLLGFGAFLFRRAH